ncbi:nucleotidyltransferase family protein [Bacillus sp. AFS017274]|uniref:nucleotidyltransferase domain-containing protein n=1 Tax=Bacillus sp. AFS017274 TaxID=2033488 RepID=UPI000BFAA6C8|nr:nucleotidyltransferase family protein [Bacillus sp. AFS017274]PEZ83320.1 Renal dipeptidase [Bacillus sp. AFS017274]
MENNNNLDLSSISRELNLLLKITVMENHGRDKSFDSEMFNDIDWGLFLQLARHHRIYPLIYSKLKRINKKYVPHHVIESLYQEYKKNTFQMLQLSGEMEQISKLFNESDIRLLFLKGPVIAHDLYGDISLRTSKDLDIIIPMTDLEKAEEILITNGYEKENQPNFLNEWKWRNHHIAFFHKHNKIQIEVHWRLEPFPSKEPSFNELWERKRTSTITRSPTYFLGKEDLFFYLVSHGARHGWFRLRWLLDIDLMLKKGLNLDKTEKLFKKYKRQHLGGQALILASQLLKTPINKRMKFLTAGNRSKVLSEWSIFFIEEMNQFNYPKEYTVLLKSKTQIFLTKMKAFYPDSRDVETIKLPKSLHFLYFILRPFLLVWRKRRKNAK